MSKDIKKDMNQLNKYVKRVIKAGVSPEKILDMIHRHTLFIEGVSFGTKFTLQDPSEFDGGNSVYIRVDARRHVRNEGIYCVDTLNGRLWHGDVTNGIVVEKD